MKIWVDDIRPAPEGWNWITGSRGTIELLDACLVEGIEVEIMSLDHDLGGTDTTRPIVLWMCDNEFWPVEVRVHSANPVGVEWLEGMIKRYKPNVETNNTT